MIFYFLTVLFPLLIDSSHILLARRICCGYLNKLKDGYFPKQKKKTKKKKNLKLTTTKFDKLIDSIHSTLLSFSLSLY